MQFTYFCGLAKLNVEEMLIEICYSINFTGGHGMTTEMSYDIQDQDDM